MRFLFQQQLLIAGNAFRKFVGIFVRNIVRKNCKRIYSAQCSTHSFGLRAKHVYIGIENCFIESRCFSVNIHFGSTFTNSIYSMRAVVFQAFTLISIHNISPKQFSCAKFGNFHKIIATHTKIEFNFFSSNRRFNTRFHHHRKVLISPRQSITQFLSIIRSGIA